MTTSSALPQPQGASGGLLEHDVELRAMGTQVHLIATGSSVDHLSRVLDQAVQRIEELEQRWSRFRAESEISRLNAAQGEFVQVSKDTVLLVHTAVVAHRESGGAFDPLLLESMLAAGYDRPFDEIARRQGDPPRRRPLPPPASLLLGCEDIEIQGNGVRIPCGTGFDPGGIGKGLAADLVSFDLIEAGAAGACVNIGGDVRVRGAGPGGGPWSVAVEHPHCAEPIALVGLEDGAVATSTTLKRRWTVAGAPQHHVIDPATGVPSTTDLELATAIAAQGWQAEVMAKSVLLRGSEHPFDVVDGGGAEALAVTHDGRVLTSQGFRAFTGARPIPARRHRLVADAPTPRQAAS